MPSGISMHKFIEVLATLALLLVAEQTAAWAQPTAPIARIITPVRDQTLRGSVTIQGSANAPAFARYELAYASEPELMNWIVIGGGIQPVESGFLGVWNTRALPDGQYALRLQVFGLDGRLSEALVRNLKLANAQEAGASAPASSAAQPPASSVTNEIQTARDLLNTLISTAARMPAAFLRGARLAVLALLAFGGYLLLKRIALFVLSRYTQRPIDYGQ
jgi:hypothetical protein